MRANFDRADGYMWQIEEMLEEGTAHVPDRLVIEIARFVRPYSRRLARSLTRDPERNPVQVLDVLFDVQERIQRRTTPALEGGEALAPSSPANFPDAATPTPSHTAP